MEEQLISLETAKLAKEKRFDVPVRLKYWFSKHHYNGISGLSYKNARLEKTRISFCYDDVNWNNEDDPEETYFSAPTQSLLQKWLREEHKIHIIIYCMEKSLEKGWETYFDIHLKQQTKLNALQSIAQKAREFKTYEEALEKGLQEALKLIEI